VLLGVTGINHDCWCIPYVELFGDYSVASLLEHKLEVYFVNVSWDSDFKSSWEDSDLDPDIPLKAGKVVQLLWRKLVN
jgi:hypothetical protein